MNNSVFDLQKKICGKYGAEFDPPEPGSKLGIAIQTLDRIPIYGVRELPTETTCGWYIHAGDWSAEDEFYKPLCVEHLFDYCELALPFIALPPRWRFITDADGYVDVWREA